MSCREAELRFSLRVWYALKRAAPRVMMGGWWLGRLVDERRRHIFCLGGWESKVGRYVNGVVMNSGEGRGCLNWS